MQRAEVNYTGYNCLLSCVSFFLDEHPDALIKELGHDGKELIFCDCNDESLYNPEHKHKETCQVGFHPQEFYQLLMKRGRLPVLVSKYIIKSPANGSDVTDEIDNSSFLNERILSGDTGILLGCFDGRYHSLLKVGDSYILDSRTNFASKRNIKKLMEMDAQNVHHILLIY